MSVCIKLRPHSQLSVEWAEIRALRIEISQHPFREKLIPETRGWEEMIYCDRRHSRETTMKEQRWAGQTDSALPRLCDRSVARFAVDNMRKVSRKQMEFASEEIKAEQPG